MLFKREEKEIEDRKKTSFEKFEQFVEEKLESYAKYFPESFVSSAKSFPISSYLKFILWALLLFIFTRLEFGLVFLIASIFFAMFSNLGTKAQGEISAYSVFNKGVKSLPGQLSASQFEDEMMHKR